MNVTKLRAAKNRNGIQLADDLLQLGSYADAYGTKNGLQRLEIVAEHYDQLTIEEAYRLLDPEAFQREIEEAEPYKWLTKTLNVLRIIFSLLPLILTWFSMSLAVIGYNNYLTLHQHDANGPLILLQLWQMGFPNGKGIPNDFLTFSDTGFTDAVLLALFLIFSVWAQNLEYKARLRAEQLSEIVRSVTRNLIDFIATEGLTRMTSDDDIEKVAKIIQAAIGHAYNGSQAITQQTQEMFDKQIKPLLKNFSGNIATLHMDLDCLAQNLTSYQQQVGSLTSASQSVATASNNLATSATNLVNTANSHANTAQEIKNEVAVLNTTQKQLVPSFAAAQQSVTQIFTNTQYQVVSEIKAVAGQLNNSMSSLGNASNDVKTAANSVEAAGHQFTTLNPQDVVRIARDVAAAADQLQKTVTSLNATLARNPAAKKTFVDWLLRR